MALINLFIGGSHYIRLFTSRKESEFCTKFFAFPLEFLKVMIARPSSILFAWNRKQLRIGREAFFGERPSLFMGMVDFLWNGYPY